MPTFCRLSKAFSSWFPNLHTSPYLGQVSIMGHTAFKYLIFFPRLPFPTQISFLEFISKFRRFLLYSVSPFICCVLWASNMWFHSHHNIWRDAQVPQRTFHYYHPETRGLDFASLMDDIKVSKTNLNSQLPYLYLIAETSWFTPGRCFHIFIADKNFFSLPFKNGYRMLQMAHFSSFMLVLTILLEWILQRNNGERCHTSSR